MGYTPDYDPFRIRFYNWKSIGVLVVSAAIASPYLIEGLVPEYKGPFRGQREFQERTVVVTGATGNIGCAISHEYAKRKFRVIMACRDMDLCKIRRREIVLATRNNAISCRHLDLEDIDSINKFANDMIENEPNLSVLINNAAVKHLEEKQLTKYGIEKMYFVNFLAPFLLTFKLLGHLEKTSEYSGDSRIVNVLGKPKKNWKLATSDINFDERRYTSDAAYKQSKLALAYFTIQLERYNRDRRNKVYVYAASPCFNSIREPSLTASTSISRINSYKEGFYKITLLQAAANAALCGIDPVMANRTRSGKLYTYFQASWSWGIADRDEDKAKHVWNHAAKLLLGIPDTSKKQIDSEKPKDSENQVQQSDQSKSKNNDQDNKV